MLALLQVGAFALQTPLASAAVGVTGARQSDAFVHTSQERPVGHGSAVEHVKAPELLDEEEEDEELEAPLSPPVPDEPEVVLEIEEELVVDEELEALEEELSELEEFAAPP